MALDLDILILILRMENKKCETPAYSGAEVHREMGGAGGGGEEVGDHVNGDLRTYSW